MSVNALEQALYFGLERYGKFYGNYVGIVSDNKDPKGRGRLKLTVPKITINRTLQNLAVPKGLYMGEGHSMEILPMIGDKVWVEFIGGDLMFPIWSFGPNLSLKDEDGNPTQPIDPEIIRFKTNKGYEILINEKSGDKPSSFIQITTPKKFTIKLDDQNETYEFSMVGEDKKGLDIIFDKSNPFYNISVKGDKEVSLSMDGKSGEVTINGGSNGGSVNIQAIRSLIDAIQKDLSQVGSGTNLGAWLGTGGLKLEDKNLLH